MSVIIPVYNVEEYLPSCLESILTQSYRDIEILLIDDGSTDKSGQICDQYVGMDSRVRVVHVPNGGVSAARNLAMRNATGEWLTFVDADDLIPEDTFAKYIHTAESENVDVVMAGMRFDLNVEGTETLIDSVPSLAFRSEKDEESNWYREIAPHSNIRTVYSSFDFVEQPVTANKNILFFSGGGQLNKEGIERFICDVWPLLKQRDSEIRLLLGGGICGVFSQERLPKDIVLKGRYDNPDDFYALGDICINPVYNGSGLKIKTFEALAHGKVTIVDPHSALGVYKPQDIPLYRAKDSQEYVNRICKFIGNMESLLRQHQACEIYICELNRYISRQYTEVFWS